MDITVTIPDAVIAELRDEADKRGFKSVKAMLTAYCREILKAGRIQAQANAARAQAESDLADLK